MRWKKAWGAVKVWGRRYLWAWAVPLAVAVVGLVLVLLLGPFTDWVAGPVVHDLGGKEEAAALNTVRKTVLQAVGGAAALSALVFTAINYRLNRRGQFTERYATAIGHLASDKLEERIGGIYALEHIMRESERDHATVVEVLSAFVRERAPTSGKEAGYACHNRGRWMHPPTGSPDPPGRAEHSERPSTDVQAALTVIGRRPRRPEANQVDLHGTDLQGAHLWGARLRNVNLENSHLEGVVLTGAHLENAFLERAHLKGAKLLFAHLQGAYLQGAHLENAELWNAHLERAHLEGAHFEHADLTDAHLKHAHLEGAFLAGAKGLDEDAGN
ncbi:pentapeptide repeat-containing protein [Nocardiopsis halophila]|uniref:pentapeptide repeat-containing protein n=1 Tax=Nocardiopsis halophila TaxID=141692 RepID=UPI000368F4E1|nr:pentapeptide repeat-containing protein [Nocardiopsis halophila]